MLGTKTNRLVSDCLLQVKKLSASFNSFTTVNRVFYLLYYFEYNDYNKVFFVIETVLKCKPDLEDVLDQLKRKSCKWYEIGVGLKVDHDFRQCQLKEGIMTSDLKRLEAVLNKWIESEYSEVSWNHLIQVLIDIELVDVAEKVKSYLQTDLSAIKKYRWVNNITVMHEGYTCTCTTIQSTCLLKPFNKFVLFIPASFLHDY